MTAKWRRIRLEIPPNLKPSDRKVLADGIIDFIIDRTQSGNDKRNNRFKAYTQEYADRKGVGRGDVDLVDSFQMLSDLQLLSHKRGELLIGFENGTTSNAKADGNITGSYGRSPNKAKARDFLGVFKKDVKRIISELDL